MIRDEGDKVVDWIRRLCDKTFVSDVVPEDWRYMIVPPYGGKGERNKYKINRGISLLSVV